MKKLMLLLLLLNSLWMWGCYSSSGDSAEGGSGSEIVGDVAYEDGDSTGRAFGPPVVDGKVFIFKTDYEANTSIDYEDYIPDDRTNTNGDFDLGLRDPGKYLIEANDNYGKAAASYVTVSGDGDPITVSTMVVKRTASLNYTINTTLSIDALDFYYTVYILGTRVYSKGDESNLNFTLGNIPYGTHDVKVVLYIEGIKYTETVNDVKFDPGVVKELVVSVK